MREALFSGCLRFRHELSEIWDASRKPAVWLLANPSIASESVPDATWTKGVGFSKRLGYGGQIFTNVFDYIATDPRDLKAAGYPCSPNNFAQILDAACRGDGSVICAWGAVLRGRHEPNVVAQVLRIAGFRTMALGMTSLGEPRHPLMLPYETPLHEWGPA